MRKLNNYIYIFSGKKLMENFILIYKYMKLYIVKTSHALIRHF